MEPTQPPRNFQRRLRTALSWLHLWVGLGVGTVFAVVALAGALLVFHVELLGLQHPHLMRHDPTVKAEVLAAVIEDWAPRGLRSLDLPREELPVWQGYFEDGHRAYFAPGDGSLLLSRSHRDDWLLWLHELHVELLGGTLGKEVLGVIGWLSLGLLLTGLYLWWPRRGQWLAQLRLHAGPPARRWRSWHRSLGVVTLPLVLLITLTGVGMIYSTGFRSVLTGLFGGSETAATTTAAGDASPDWDQVLARANASLPNARVTRVSVPKPGEDAVSFRAHAAGEWHPVGRSQVRVDRSGRHTLQVVDASRHAAGLRIHQAIYPLHIGAVGGPVVRWLGVLAGLMPAFLLVTGFLFWRRRRGK